MSKPTRGCASGSNQFLSDENVYAIRKRAFQMGYSVSIKHIRDWYCRNGSFYRDSTRARLNEIFLSELGPMDHSQKMISETILPTTKIKHVDDFRNLDLYRNNSYAVEISDMRLQATKNPFTRAMMKRNMDRDPEGLGLEENNLIYHGPGFDRIRKKKRQQLDWYESLQRG
jgi:hypothetical protein